MTTVILKASTISFSFNTCYYHPSKTLPADSAAFTIVVNYRRNLDKCNRIIRTLWKQSMVADHFLESSISTHCSCSI